jgi:hypothetical protein
MTSADAKPADPTSKPQETTQKASSDFMISPREKSESACNPEFILSLAAEL